jgi:hypothetical protein
VGGARGREEAQRPKQQQQQGDEQVLMDLLAGEKLLKKQKNRLTAATETVTDDMYAEVQQLCEILGVPYVLAPSECKKVRILPALLVQKYKY